MAVVIAQSSDSESDCDVTTMGSCWNTNERISRVPVEVNTNKVATPVSGFDLTITPLSKYQKSSRHGSAPSAVLDFTVINSDNFCADMNLSSNIQKFEVVTDSQEFKEYNKNPRITTRKDNDKTKGRGVLRSPNQPLTKMSSYHSASVESSRFPIIENQLTELLTDTATGETTSLRLKQQNKEFKGFPDVSNATTLKSCKPFVDPLQEELFLRKATGSNEGSFPTRSSQTDNICVEHKLSSSTFIRVEETNILSPTSESLGTAHTSFSQRITGSSFSPSLPVGASIVQPPLSPSRNGSFTHSSTFFSLDSDHLPQTIPYCESFKLDPLCDDMTFGKASKSCLQSPDSSPSIYLDEESCLSPLSYSWEESNEEEKDCFELYHSPATQDDQCYVCPTALKNLMHRGADVMVDEEDSARKPQMLCHQRLRLVYTTIDVSYQEGTLQLLSDLLLPGFYPPKDITSHLLKGILLNPQSPHHSSVQAFDLLMRTQRHHMADKLSVPWDWEMLCNVLEMQEHPPEIVQMFLEYVVQTLEDDFKAKQTTSGLCRSIVKAVLSFDHQFSHIRDVCKWLFAAIEKSSSNEMRGEYIRIVATFQRMLSLALEVDCSPAVCSAKLSQELFYMLISNVPLRAQRMMLLESLQSKLLRCKLLEHLLDYFCPVKTSVPMSLTRLLHFLENCMLSPDPKDGTEKWRKWDELVCLLWMLLLSYSHAMKGYLFGSKTEKGDRVGPSVYKPEDVLSKCAICDAVEAFRSRSQEDVGEALPLHVTESLYFLQDHLLDVCQC